MLKAESLPVREHSHSKPGRPVPRSAPLTRQPVRLSHPWITPARCRLGAFILFALMIGIGALPGKADALSAVVYDKLLHFCAYAALSLLVFYGFTGELLNRALWTPPTIGVLGGIDESIQMLMPYRHAGLDDSAVDMLAAAACVGLLCLLHASESGAAARHAE